MIVMGLEVPRHAEEAGLSAMEGRFRLEDVRAAIAAALQDHETEMDYGANDSDGVHRRIADRLLQRESRLGKIEHVHAGEWRSIGSRDKARSGEWTPN